MRTITIRRIIAGVFGFFGCIGLAVADELVILDKDICVGGLFAVSTCTTTSFEDSPYATLKLDCRVMERIGCCVYTPIDNTPHDAFSLGSPIPIETTTTKEVETKYQGVDAGTYYCVQFDNRVLHHYQNPQLDLYIPNELRECEQAPGGGPHTE